MESSPTSTPAPLITARGVAKQFAGERALAGVDFELRPGEIHALLGENGAGKSTLIKILAGVTAPDGGEIEMGGNRLPSRFTPADVSGAGVAFVHQDLGLVDDLSVGENIALAVGYRKRFGLISFSRSERAAAGLLADLGMSIAADRLVGDLTQDEKVMVAVARAFATHAKAIVLDEVSSSLPAPEVERLMQSLAAARIAGVGYVYVTHRLSEVFAIADRVTVLRDGAVVASAPVAGLAHEQLVEWILGSAGVADYAPNAARVASAEPQRPLRLEVEGLLAPGLTEPISFAARQGEIIGVCGLVGCGARELARVLGGASAPTAGGARLDGEPLPLGSPGKLRRAGCTYVPGDRQVEGGVLDMSVRENLFLNRHLAQPGEGPAQDGDVAGRFISPRRERRNAAQLMGQFEVRPRGAIDRPLSSLSGGNQQKVICGRALRTQPRLLVVDDPTAGVDVASRAQLHAILRATAAQGTTIILASTDFDEVASEADRALVMVAGASAEILAGPDLTSDRLARASYGAAPDPVSGGKR